MIAKDKTVIAFKLFGSSFLIIFLAACAAKMFTYQGSWVAQDDRISVQAGGPHKGSWQTRDVTIEYAYQQDTQNLQISGVVKLADYLTTGFSTLEYLTLDIYSLNADGIVLDTLGAQTFGYRRYLDALGKMTFKKQMDLPDGTSAIAFGYRGKVIHGGGGFPETRTGDRIDWQFWEVPGRKPS